MLQAIVNPHTAIPREGELYKTVDIAGKRFHLYYGYYEDFEREHHEPMPIYPDLVKNPIHAENGMPIVTAMQDACPHHIGPPGEGICHECAHFQPEEDLFGLCRCIHNRHKPVNPKDIQNETVQGG